MKSSGLAVAAFLSAVPAFALEATVQKSSVPAGAEAASLAAVWGLDLATLTAAHEAGHDWSEVGEAAQLAASSGFSLGTVLAMRESGLSWAEVGVAVNVDGVDMRDAPRDPAPVRRAAPRKAAKGTTPKTVVIKGKGPKMDPARLRSVW